MNRPPAQRGAQIRPIPDIVPLPQKLQLAVLEVSIDKKRPVFATSGWISGNIKLTTTKQTTGKETMLVALEGITTVAFDNCALKKYEVSDLAEHPLPPMSANEVKTMPFKFYLQPQLPSSFQGKHGATAYQIRAVLQDEKKIGRNEGFEKFNVVTNYDLNSDLAANHPIETTKEDKFIGSGTLKMTVSIDHTGFVPGEKIRITGSFHNNSIHTVGRIKAKLVENVSYTANERMKDPKKIGRQRTKQVTTVIAKVKEYVNLKKGETHQWENDDITVPMTTIPSRSDDAIEVRHSLVISMHPNSWPKNLVIELPLKVGNVAVRPSSRVVEEKED